MLTEDVIIVTEDDKVIGSIEKMKAHKQAILHRAFSVFIFNSKGELLLQQRANHKYHSPSLWTNTVCSHPRKGENTNDAAHRRIIEEMGFDCDFEEIFSFVYNADVGKGLTEHEFDHVFVGVSDTQPLPNKSEVDGWKYISMVELDADLKNNPDNYTVWFKIAITKVLDYFKKNKIK